MQQMTDGALTAVDDCASNTVMPDVAEEAEEAASLRGDVLCILVECHRDRHLAVFRDGLNGEAIAALADVVARRLAPRIGGRYVPKRDARAARDAAVWKAWNGRNREDVMRQFRISRALLYSILARRPRATT
jgi:Mor family transcriptional regulator